MSVIKLALLALTIEEYSLDQGFWSWGQLLDR